MKLPAGTQGGVVLDPKNEDMVEHLRTFRGAIEIDTAGERDLSSCVTANWLLHTSRTKTVFTGGRCGTMYHGHPGE